MKHSLFYHRLEQSSVNVCEQLLNSGEHRQRGGMSMCPPGWKHQHSRKVNAVACSPAPATHTHKTHTNAVD